MISLNAWKFITIEIFISMIVITVLVFLYLPALNGPFLLDDVVNIPATKITEFTWESIGQVATTNRSGMFGRPVPVLTFMLNHLFGDGGTFSFKLTNLMIHLINSLLIYKLAFVIYKIAGDQLNTSPRLNVVRVTALITAVVWVIHPLQVSSVMYVVQRMTLMMTLFSLCAILTFIHGRNYLEKSNNGFLVMVCGLVLFGSLALMSKENGALIVIYVLLIEAFLFKFQFVNKQRKKYHTVFLVLFVVSPIILGLYYFAGNYISIIEGYEELEFSLSERLMTEPGVLVMYLNMIIFPDISQMSLYYDDYPISSYIDANVVLSICVLGALLYAMYKAAGKSPLITLGIGIFLISHLLESTLIPLEIAFEHRNYFAIFGIILPVVWYGMLFVRRYVFYRAGLAFVSFVVLIFGFQTHGRAMEWSHALILNQIAVSSKPLSSRAKSALAVNLVEQGQYKDAIDLHRESAKIRPNDLYYPLAIVQIRCFDAQFEYAEFKQIETRLSYDAISMKVVSVLSDLVTNHYVGVCARPDYQDLEKLLKAAIENKNKYISDQVLAELYVNYSTVLMRIKRPALSISALHQALELIPNDPGILIRLLNVQLTLDMLVDARKTLAQLENVNKKLLGIYKSQINVLRQYLLNKNSIRVKVAEDE